VKMITATTLDTGPGDRRQIGLSARVMRLWGWRAKICGHDPGKALGPPAPIGTDVVCPGGPHPETGTACEPCRPCAVVAQLTGDGTSMTPRSNSRCIASYSAQLRHRYWVAVAPRLAPAGR